MRQFYDALETRSDDERIAGIAAALPGLVAKARNGAPAFAASLADLDPEEIRSLEDLRRCPVLRKAEISRLQSEHPPLGGLSALDIHAYSHVFQSPGPVYEPGNSGSDWWRMGRFLHACGIGKGDIVQNCLSYHLVPAGLIFEGGARAVGATVLPAGTGNTELQVRAAAQVGVTAYAGTPDFLKVILDKADELGVDLSRIAKAAVGGGALFPSLRAHYADRGIRCLQNYATADLGNVAYETVPDEGLIVDEGVLVEIVTPGTGDPVESGRIGEVVVTTLNEDYPLIRFATGDLSAVLPGRSECGRTNMRLAGWKGRADQTAKVKGMFVRPEQVARFVARHDGVERARVEVSRENEMDSMKVIVESRHERDAADLEATISDIFGLRGTIEIRPPDSLPDDGKVIDDLRDYG